MADAFVEACRKTHPADRVATVDVFGKDLPVFDGPILDAKYAILHGQPQSPQQREAWKAVEAIIREFTSADRYVLAAPMWNFGIPYRLKQYIDILVQPGCTFSYSPAEGYKGLVTGKPILLVCARGGEYSQAGSAALDMQKPYLELILRFIGFADIRSLLVEPTLAGGPDVAKAKTLSAIEQARKLAESF